jgi:hypothetical protein
MALPREIRTSKVIEVQAAIKKMSPQQIGELPGLDDDDLKMFGTLIQHFCFIDLNLRRASEIFVKAKMLSEERYSKLPDSKLAEILLDIVTRLDATVEDIPTAIGFLEGISKARGTRNIVGHFAGKRFPNHDVYVFASKNDKDAMKVLGHDLQNHHVQTAVAGRSELFEMTNSVGLAQLWLGGKIPEWDERYL